MDPSVTQERPDAGTDADLDVLMLPLPGSYEDELVGELEARGVTVRTNDGFFKILRGFATGGLPDAVHLHFLGFFISRTQYQTALVPLVFGFRLVVELLVARLLGVRVVWTVHDLVHHEATYPRIEKAYRHVVARLCNRILVHCDTAGELIREEYRLPDRISNRIRTVPHGNYLPRYPDELSAERARERLNVDPETRTFLFFGHIRPYKNVEGLIETFKRIDAPNAELLVVGNPFDDRIGSRIRSLAAEDDRVRTVLEFVPDEDVQLYMRAADVVVLPFAFESALTSGSVILAMTFERPVIAPRFGCTAELLDASGGFPYDPDDPDGLERELRRAVTADLSGMGEHNFEQVESLDWGWIAERTIRSYTA